MAKRQADPDLLRRTGARLRVLRRECRLSQQALAAKAGVDWKYLGAVERGERNPSLDVLWHLATALGVDLPQLFYFRDSGVAPADRVAERRVLYALNRARGEDKLLLRDLVERVLRWRDETSRRKPRKGS